MRQTQLYASQYAPCTCPLNRIWLIFSLIMFCIFNSAGFAVAGWLAVPNGLEVRSSNLHDECECRRSYPLDKTRKSPKNDVCICPYLLAGIRRP